MNTQKSLYEFNRLSFGVKVTPSTFQQIMDMMLADENFAIAYDVIKKCGNQVQHFEHIKNIFERIK